MVGAFVVGQLPIATAVAEADLAGQAELVEQGQRAVDAGKIDVAGVGDRQLVDLLGREMARGLGQHRQHGLAGGRQAVPGGAEAIGDVHAHMMPRVARLAVGAGPSSSAPRG
jgi:hypothetical protein